VASQRCFSAAAGSSEYLTFFRVIKALLEHVGLGDVGLSTEKVEGMAPSQVKYLHICETKHFSMGVFVLGKGARIPLHDHPDMTVLSKILVGDVRVWSYDWLTHPSDNGLANGDAHKVKPAKMHLEAIVQGPSPPRTLYPSQGNLHTFLAITAAAILDIQGPPYNDHDRECCYYRVVPQPDTTGGAGEHDQEVPDVQLRPNGHQRRTMLASGDDSSDDSADSRSVAASPVGSRPASPVGSRPASHNDGNRSDAIVYLQRDDPAFAVDIMNYEGPIVNEALLEISRPTVNLTPELFLRQTPQTVPSERINDLKLQ